MQTLRGIPGVDRPFYGVSLFSGIGGADRGLYAASEATGIPAEIVFAGDIWDRATAQYNRNMPHAVARVADVKKMTLADIPPHDFIIGGPPCQPFSKGGKQLGTDDVRDCVPDFIRLSDNGRTPFVMENVVGGLLDRFPVKAHSVRLAAADFGDCTSRHRFFYSNVGQFVDSATPRFFADASEIPLERAAETRHFRNIRDRSADERHLAIVRERIADGTLYVDGFERTSDTSGLFDLVEGGFDRAPDYVTDGNGNLRPDAIDNILVVMRGFNRSLRMFGPDDILGGLTGNVHSALSWGHCGAGARCPSVLEGQRSHGFPDHMDWTGVTSEADRMKMIANSWPVGMATAVMSGLLVALKAQGMAKAA